MAQFICKTFEAQLTLLSASRRYQTEADKQKAIETYLSTAAEKLRSVGIQAQTIIRSGPTVETTQDYVDKQGIDLVIVTTRGHSGENNWLRRAF